MAGAANTERQSAFIAEVAVGTTPATPGFTKTAFDVDQFQANPRISEGRSLAFNGQRSSVATNGIAVSGSGSGKLIYGEFDPFLESLFQSTWSTNVLVNGTDQHTFTYEQAIPQGAGGALAYTRHRGVEAVGGSITLTAGSDASISFDFIGQGSDDATATLITGATYADPASVAILGSGADIGTILMSGLTPLDCMSELSIDFGIEDKEEQLRLSSDDACGITRGVMIPKIVGKFYIETNFIAIYNAARAGTEFALTVPIGSVTTEKYSISFPKCQFAMAPLETGENGPAFQSIEILPYYDSGIGGTCEITRAVV